MARGVKFGNIHSYNTLELILMPFAIPPAEPKINLLDIPGGDGSIDLTEALGGVKFKDREFVMKFTVDPRSDMTFDEKVTQVANRLNGRAFKIIFDRDSDYYWEGRCIVSEHAQSKVLQEITIKAIVRPYKMKTEETVVEFDLSSDWKLVTLSNNGRKTVVPTITCTNDGTEVTYNNSELDISVSDTFDAGVHKDPYIQLPSGASLIYIAGTGTITFSYREGVL